jgi:hypothetical protein
MRADENRHGQAGRALGGAELPAAGQDGYARVLAGDDANRLPHLNFRLRGSRIGGDFRGLREHGGAEQYFSFDRRIARST